MTQTSYFIWVSDGVNKRTCIAVCKSAAEADATRGFYAGTQPDKFFTITKGL